jgi:hypothetical protein
MPRGLEALRRFRSFRVATQGAERQDLRRGPLGRQRRMRALSLEPLDDLERAVRLLVNGDLDFA